MSLYLSVQVSRDPSNAKSERGIQLDLYIPIAEGRSTSGLDPAIISNRASSDQFSFSSTTSIANDISLLGRAVTQQSHLVEAEIS